MFINLFYFGDIGHNLSLISDLDGRALIKADIEDLHSSAFTRCTTEEELTAEKCSGQVVLKMDGQVDQIYIFKAQTLAYGKVYIIFLLSCGQNS